MHFYSDAVMYFHSGVDTIVGKRFSNCCKRGGFVGAGKSLNLKRRAHIQTACGLANSELFVGKIH